MRPVCAFAFSKPSSTGNAMAEVQGQLFNALPFEWTPHGGHSETARAAAALWMLATRNTSSPASILGVHIGDTFDTEKEKLLLKICKHDVNVSTGNERTALSLLMAVSEARTTAFVAEQMRHTNAADSVSHTRGCAIDAASGTIVMALEWLPPFEVPPAWGVRGIFSMHMHTLADMLRNIQFVPDRVWRATLLQILDTLATLQVRIPHFMHNDLKPENIVLTQQPNAVHPRAVLIDFEASFSTDSRACSPLFMPHAAPIGYMEKFGLYPSFCAFSDQYLLFACAWRAIKAKPPPWARAFFHFASRVFPSQLFEKGDEFIVRKDTLRLTRKGREVVEAAWRDGKALTPRGACEDAYFSWKE